jgi:signal transduction histidine kinase
MPYADKAKKRRSLSVTISISFLSFVLTSLLVSGIMGTLFSFQTQRDIVFSQQQHIAQNAANIVGGFIQEKLIAMEITSEMFNPAFAPIKEQERMLNLLLGHHPAFRQLILINSKKQKSVVVSRLSRQASGNLGNSIERDLYTWFGRDKRYISPVYVDGITSEPMVIIAVPAKDVFGDIQGALVAEVNLKFMWDLMVNLRIGKTGQAYVVDRQGRLIASGDISRVLRGENAGNLKLIREFISNPVSIVEAEVDVFTGINGTTVLGTYIPLGVPDWAVVTELPLSEAYQTVIQLIIIMVIFTLVMAALAGWIGIFLARRLSSPIVNLMETATRIAGGERGLLAEVSGPVEISNLAEAFNSMTAQLREVIGDLEQHGAYLQTTVQKYVEYMAGVGEGRLDSRLVLEEQKSGTDDPLIVLGRQLNETTTNLNIMIEQIRNSSDKIKKHEEKLQIYSERLRKSNTELEQFAYIASHDLQEPLRKIKFFVDRFKTKYSGNLNEEALEYLERTNDAVVRMVKFIQDLLQYARVTTKAKPFERVDLNEIIKGVISDLDIRINETKAEIRTENLPVIDADLLQMRQLFQNIIGNAIKYHLENITPVINLNSRISSDEDNNFCEINITDNGIGFDNKYADQIFGLFQRLHGRSEYEGTGIGLAICKKIVEQHGGVISAAGREGEGAVFSIKLPLKQKAAD